MNTLIKYENDIKGIFVYTEDIVMCEILAFFSTIGGCGLQVSLFYVVFVIVCSLKIYMKLSHMSEQN